MLNQFKEKCLKMPKWFYNIIKSNLWFWILSGTWGAILTLIGFIVSLPFLIYIACTDDTSFYAEKGHCVYFIIGEGWGGFNLGPFCFVSKTAKLRTYAHEHGHALQNCLLGPFAIPFYLCSVIRYHYRNLREKLNKPCKTSYDDFWFEGQASSWGIELFNNCFREE
jgi:hypothetical protein